MKITAILGIRNDAKYLRISLQHLVDNGIQLAIIDHDSIAATKRIYASFAKHIVYRERMPYNGYFSLTEQLAAKSRVISMIDADWVIHQDADEILESPRENETLREGIERVASQGFDVINFDEFVFIPTRQHPDYEKTDFYRAMLNYYFFEPQPMRLMRVWRNIPGIRQIDGGHRLGADAALSVFPEPFVLRHYIALSKKGVYDKYLQRNFSTEDLARGWHRNRLKFPPDIDFPDQANLDKLTSWESKLFQKNNPRKLHFWQDG